MLSFSLSFASNLNFSLTFSKSYGKMKNILKAIVGWFATWNHNVANFSPESYFKGWNISKQAKCNKSQEESAGTEKVLQVRGFWTARGRTAPMEKQICIKFHSVHCKGSSEIQLFISTVENQCPVVKRRNTTHEHNTERTKIERASWKIIKPSISVE